MSKEAKVTSGKLLGSPFKLFSCETQGEVDATSKVTLSFIPNNPNALLSPISISIHQFLLASVWII